MMRIESFAAAMTMAALIAQPANATALRCPPTTQAMGALLSRLPQLSLTPGAPPGVIGPLEKRTYNGRSLDVLGVTPDRVEAAFYRPGGPVSSVHFWIAGQDKGRYAAAMKAVVPGLERPCDKKSMCSWWVEPRPPIGSLERVELGDSFMEKAHLRFTCGYRSY